MDKLPLTVSLKDNPNLQRLVQSEPESARTILKAFTSIFDKACEERWDLLPKEFDKSGEMTFEALLHGVLLGSFSVKEMIPELYPIMGASIHPLSIVKKQNLFSTKNGDAHVYDWREFYALPRDSKVDKDTIATILRNMLRYNRWIPSKEFYEALGEGGDAITIFKQMDENQVAKLAFLPALKYQRKHLGELKVGTFLGETGAFDCGTISVDESELDNCQACQVGKLEKFNNGTNTAFCPSCQAGFTIVE